MKRNTLIATFGVLAASSAALAQPPRYNIDLGGPATAPAAAYGAASGQIGCWTVVNGPAATNLVTLGGCAATADVIVGTGGVGGTFNHPNTMANHQRHMDDWVNLGPAATNQQYTIILNTLAAPHWYAVWTYSWGSQPGVCSGVNVNVLGSIDPPVLVADCGAWAAGMPGAAPYNLWQHFAYHEVLVFPGMPITIDLTVDPASPNNGRLNGIQLVPIMGPDDGDGIPPNWNENGLDQAGGND